jgi:Cytochrome c554 and c-prime
MRAERVGIGLALALAAGALCTAVRAEDAPKPTYVGSAKCKMCHIDDHKAWAASKHATAFSVLKPEEASKAECAECHTTGFEMKAETVTYVEAAVGCETCHGPGSLYTAKGVKDKKAFKADPEGSRKAWAAAGLVKGTEAMCKDCHNEKSPTFKGFDAAEAMAKIKHWEDEAPAESATPVTK